MYLHIRYLSFAGKEETVIFLSCAHRFFVIVVLYSFFFSFIFISWRLITLQYCSGFCHTLTWISHGFTCITHPNPPTTSLSTWSLFPVHQAQALVSCIQPGAHRFLTPLEGSEVVEELLFFEILKMNIQLTRTTREK